MDTTSGESQQSDFSSIPATSFFILENEWSEIWIFPIRDRSIDTELVDGNDNAKKQLCGRPITIVVNR